MEANKKNISSILIIILLLFGGILFYFQQKSINQLKEAVMSSSSDSQTQMAKKTGLENSSTQPAAVKDPANISSSIDQQKKKFESTVKFIKGKVISVSGNVLTVEVDMPDWKKMEEIASSADLSQQYKSKMAPTIKKNFNVSTTGETKFSGDQLSEIKAGETIMVYSKEIVSQTDKLTAVEVVAPYQSALPPGIQQ